MTARSLLPLAIAVLCGGCGDRPAPPAGPPVLLVVMDALAAGHVHHLGYERETTPNLDRLAAEGVTFTQAFAPAPFTLASIPSLLTGRLPDAHGVIASDRVLAQDEETLAELLAARGWRTFAAVANLNGSAVYGLSQGFETFLEMYRPEDARERAGQADRGAARSGEGLRAFRSELHLPRADEYLPVLQGWLTELEPGEQPFFYLHMLEPHSPYQPPAPFRERWLDPDYDGPFEQGDSETLLDELNGRIERTARDEAAVRALYDANLAYGDAVLGQLFDALRAAGRWDETLVIVTSDHGEAFWQHGRWGHNAHVFDEMVGVPLVVKFPMSWNRRGRAVDRLVSILDVVPSVCEWTGTRAPARLDGRSLEDVLAADEPDALPDRALLLRSHDLKPDVGLRTPRQKVVWREDPGQFEVYDLAADPGEHAPRRPDDVEGGPQLTGNLRLLMRAAAAKSGQGAPDLSDEELELLRKLGYL